MAKKSQEIVEPDTESGIEDFEEPEFSIFGQLDSDEIPDDPFYIAPNLYDWVVLGASYKDSTYENEDGDVTKTNAVIRLGIDQPDSEYHGQTHSARFTVYPKLTKSDFELMSPDERATVRRNLSNFKVFLKALGLSETEVAKIRRNTIHEMLLGKHCNAKLVENQDKNDPDRVWRNLVNYKPCEGSDGLDPWTVTPF